LTIQPSGAANVFSVIGALDRPPASPIVTLGLDSADAASVIANNTSFEAEFPGFTAAQMVTAILDNDTATLWSFFLNPEVLSKMMPFPGGGELINFDSTFIAVPIDGGPISADFTPS
jgi:hypothetical protein